AICAILKLRRTKEINRRNLRSPPSALPFAKLSLLTPPCSAAWTCSSSRVGSANTAPGFGVTYARAFLFLAFRLTKLAMQLTNEASHPRTAESRCVSLPQMKIARLPATAEPCGVLDRREYFARLTEHRIDLVDCQAGLVRLRTLWNSVAPPMPLAARKIPTSKSGRHNSLRSPSGVWQV